MKLIKYWHVKLYRNLSTIALSTPMETLIFEGYSKDKPVLKPHDEGLIELFTAPDGLETKTIRTRGFGSMVCTPVYEEDDKAAADTQGAKSRYDYESFKSAARPLVKWLNENANPHALVIVESDGATLYTGEIDAPVREFIKD